MSYIQRLLWLGVLVLLILLVAERLRGGEILLLVVDVYMWSVLVVVHAFLTALGV